MTQINLNRLKRQTNRVQRKQHHNWSLRIGEDTLITRNITNLSPTGLSFKAPEWSEFKSGQEIKVQFFLNKDESFECEAKIIWIKQTQERAGNMQVLGLEFSKLPLKIDGAIMKLINDEALNDRRTNFSKDFSDKFLILPKSNFKTAFGKVMGALMVVSLTASLMAALYLHEKFNPENTLAYKLSNVFNKRLSTLDLATEKE